MARVRPGDHFDLVVDLESHDPVSRRVAARGPIVARLSFARRWCTVACDYPVTGLSVGSVASAAASRAPTPQDGEMRLQHVRGDSSTQREGLLVALPGLRGLRAQTDAGEVCILDTHVARTASLGSERRASFSRRRSATARSRCSFTAVIFPFRLNSVFLRVCLDVEALARRFCHKGPTLRRAPSRPLGHDDRLPSASRARHPSRDSHRPRFGSPDEVCHIRWEFYEAVECGTTRGRRAADTDVGGVATQTALECSRPRNHREGRSGGANGRHTAENLDYPKIRQVAHDVVLLGVAPGRRRAATALP